ncbi:MAG: 50S ribosomal protein L32 [Halobacteria archaeon]
MTTASFGKRNVKKTHIRCRRCGRVAYHIRHRLCAFCGYPRPRRRVGVNHP